MSRPAAALRARSLRTWLPVVLLALLWSAAIARTVQGAAEPLPALASEQAKLVARGIAAREPSLRVRSRKQFPYDLWSQDDAFHAGEQAAVRAAAGRAEADLGSVLNALDTYLRSHPSLAHKPGASPCKPRPFYD